MLYSHPINSAQAVMPDPTHIEPEELSEENRTAKAADRVQRLQQERSQQLLRCNRRPSNRGVQVVEPRFQLLWRRIGRGS
jgi:hypothetical protein